MIANVGSHGTRLASFVRASGMVLSILVLSVMPQTGFAGHTVNDSKRGFTLTLPEGFEPDPERIGARPGFVHAFIHGDSGDDQIDVHLFIEELPGTIGRQRLTRKDLPAGFRGRLFTTTWQGFQIDAFEVPERIGEVETLTYNVTIPLKRAAIQLKLFGPTDRKHELDVALEKILANLDGESSWQSTQSTPASSFLDAYGFVLLGVALLIVVGGLVGLWFISKFLPKGAVLAIALAIFLVSWTDLRVHDRKSPSPIWLTRMILVTTGSLRMLGFAGGILGVVDLLRKRRNVQPPAAAPPQPLDGQ